MSTRVGVLGGTRGAVVDRFGTVRPDRVNWELAWWIGGDDRWHFPEQEVAVRQSLLDCMPVVCTAMRLPGGDAVERVFGGAPDTTVVEIANESPAPFAAALVVRGAAQVATDGGAIVVDGRTALVGARAPARWAAATDGTTARAVTLGAAGDHPFASLRDRAARLEVAFLYPVAHGTGLSFTLLASPFHLDAPVVRVPDAEGVARGWRAQLGRGMRVELPDPALQAATDTARAQLLLEAQAWLPDPAVVAALEEWGFDDEARAAWPRLGWLARRKAGRRSQARATWDEVRIASSAGAAPFLGALRRAVVHEAGTQIDLLADWPAQWRGRPLDVRDAPTRRGQVSYSLRWHGDRVAFLWEAPEGVTVRVPGLEPGWSSPEPRGEVLLAPGG